VPWQQQQQQQQQQDEHPVVKAAHTAAMPVADSNALQLAACVVLEDDVDIVHGASDWGSLSCSAYLSPSAAAAAGLPGPVLGLLRQLPAEGPPRPAATAPQGAAGPAAAEAVGGTAAENELRGLQVMLAALQSSWQSGEEGARGGGVGVGAGSNGTQPG